MNEQPKRGRRAVSCHPQFDDARYWRFERDSRIPHGTFETRGHRVGDRAVFAVCAAIIVGLVVWEVAARVFN
jgi:hypothetical protein